MARTRSASAVCRRFCRPRCEALESRALPASIAWICDSGDWTTPSCWDLNRLPEAGDEVVINRPGDITVTHSTGSTAIENLTSQENLELSGGTLEVAAASVVEGAFTLSGGTLAGAGTFTVNGVMTWSSGRMQTFPFPGPSGRTIAAGGLELIGGGSKRMDNRSLENQLAAVTTGGEVTISQAPGGRLVNESEAYFLVNRDSPLYLDTFASGFRGSFSNRGVLHVRGCVCLRASIFSNGGYVELEGGSLNVLPIAVALGSVGGSGYFHLNPGNVTGFGGLGESGAIWGTGYLRITADMSRILGSVEITGRVALGSSLGIEISGPFAVDGPVVVESTSVVRPRGTTVYAASVHIAGRWLPGPGGGLYSTGDITNAGNVMLAPGTWMAAAGSYRQTGGSTSLTDSYLYAGKAVAIEGGVLSGTGLIEGALWNYSQVAVGGPNTTGQLEVRGPYVQDAGATLTMKLGGTTPESYDRLMVSETASLDGTLAVRLLGSFEPMIGDAFTILTAADLDGTRFATLDLPTLDGRRLDPVYGVTGLRLVTVAGTAPDLGGFRKREQRLGLFAPETSATPFDGGTITPCPAHWPATSPGKG